MHENVKVYDGLTDDGDVAHCCIIFLKSSTQKSKYQYQRDHLVGQSTNGDGGVTLVGNGGPTMVEVL